MDKLLRTKTLENGSRIELVQGDITRQEVDAIVNAANRHLAHGGGLAGAIVRRGGADIQAESRAWVREHGPVEHAKPAYTGAGVLPSRYVIHAVGPVWGDGDEDAKLAAAVRGSLELAEHLGLRSIALPAISTGIFGFPKARAGRVTLEALQEYFQDHPDTTIELARLVLYDQPSVDAFLDAWDA